METLSKYKTLGIFLLSCLLSFLSSASVAETIIYKYDVLGRLIRVDDQTNTPRNFQYDPAGNRTKVTLGAPIPTAPPAAPTGLTSYKVADCAYTARWDFMTGATYYLFGDTGGGTARLDGTNTKTVSCYNDSPKPKWVQSCNVYGCSIKSYF